MIGVFDSGYGGLTILKEIVKVLPQYDYLYLGDNARTPYGNHSKETVTRFTDEAMQYLFGRGCSLIIIACFTASALTLHDLQKKFKDRKILGVIRPIVEKAATITTKNRIGVVGTKSTVTSKSFEIELKNLNPKITVVQQACPLLVPLIEEHQHEKPEARMILRKYLRPLESHHIDILILGCTHYPLMYRDFKKMMGENVIVLNPGEIVAESLKNYLDRHPEIETKLARNENRTYCTTDDPAKFLEFGKSFLKLPIEKVEKIAFSIPTR